ncbi:AraC family transcriptional regulator [Neptunicella marina]|uniref:AraC family transcriptional regulator n=1 Tax=Neptunicella marina TaxID=2125989 RepID=A0A8J6IU24_9ALTE|nr:AraC family transcriptional regulator [Neptunicella marina]MBC3765633.1 AraC family transcriptional regulator [Neptunicella marina]
MQGKEGAIASAVEGLFLARVCCSTGPIAAIQQPALSVIIQGSKQVCIGNESYSYDPFHYMLSTADLPVTARVTLASETEASLGIKLLLDSKEISLLLADENLPTVDKQQDIKGIQIHPLKQDLLDPLIRLIKLLETPEDIPILAPLIKREIYYRLIRAGLGKHLQQVVMQDGHVSRIARVLNIMHENYRQPLKVDDLAKSAHMSVSALHHHFKSFTAISPLQYHKNLRLQEARRLILSTDQGVAAIAREVGYESPSQFSREYRRLFDVPPAQEKQRWAKQA